MFDKTLREDRKVHPIAQRFSLSTGLAGAVWRMAIVVLAALVLTPAAPEQTVRIGAQLLVSYAARHRYLADIKHIDQELLATNSHMTAHRRGQHLSRRAGWEQASSRATPHGASCASRTAARSTSTSDTFSLAIDASSMIGSYTERLTVPAFASNPLGGTTSWRAGENLSADANVPGGRLAGLRIPLRLIDRVAVIAARIGAVQFDHWDLGMGDAAVRPS